MTLPKSILKITFPFRAPALSQLYLLGYFTNYNGQQKIIMITYLLLLLILSVPDLTNRMAPRARLPPQPLTQPIKIMRTGFSLTSLANEDFIAYLTPDWIFPQR